MCPLRSEEQRLQLYRVRLTSQTHKGSIPARKRYFLLPCMFYSNFYFLQFTVFADIIEINIHCKKTMRDLKTPKT